MRVPRRRITLLEDPLTQALWDRWRYLKRPDTIVASVPNKRAFGQPFLTPGAFDLLCIGGSVGIGLMELKTEAGRLSDPQKEFRRVCDRAGVTTAVAYGLDEAVRGLEAWGLMSKAIEG